MGKTDYEPWQDVECILAGKSAWATDAHPDRSGKPYRPGSGTEGMAFDEAWCDHCARDAELRKDWDNADPAIGCQILANTFAYDISDPRYPKEWIYSRKDGRPCCTAFTTDPSKPMRCDQTPDLFGPTP